MALRVSSAVVVAVQVVATPKAAFTQANRKPVSLRTTSLKL
jgi:hypothetical protein